MIESWDIRGGVLEYIDETHTYLYEGVILPSVTQLLQKKFSRKYDGIPEHILKRAADLGTALHKAIEDYEKHGTESALVEFHNYKALKAEHDFEVVGNEIPVVLFDGEEAVAAGRLDLFLAEKDALGLADIKRTSKLDKNYLAYQLNIYRVAFMQSYDCKIEFLRGIHLREKVAQYIEIPVDESFVKEILNMEENI